MKEDLSSVHEQYKDQTPAIQSDVVPDQLKQAAALRSVELTNRAWADLRELERFALCKLARPGHDHHNLEAALSEVLG